MDFLYGFSLGAVLMGVVIAVIASSISWQDGYTAGRADMHTELSNRDLAARIRLWADTDPVFTPPASPFDWQSDEGAA